MFTCARAPGPQSQKASCSGLQCKRRRQQVCPPSRWFCLCCLGSLWTCSSLPKGPRLLQQGIFLGHSSGFHRVGAPPSGSDVAPEVWPRHGAVPSSSKPSSKLSTLSSGLTRQDGPEEVLQDPWSLFLSRHRSQSYLKNQRRFYTIDMGKEGAGDLPPFLPGLQGRQCLSGIRGPCVQSCLRILGASD